MVLRSGEDPSIWSYRTRLACFHHDRQARERRALPRLLTDAKEPLSLET